MKKNILTTIFLSLLISMSLKAQLVSLNYAKQLGGGSPEVGLAIKEDANGNVYTTGRFMGICDVDPGPGVVNLTSNGNTDIFVSKVDANGNFLWAKGIGGPTIDEGKALTLDASGNVYITGSFESVVDFDPGVGTFNLTSGGNADLFVLKLDASGNFVWAKQFSGSGSEYGWSVVTDASSNVFFTAIFYTLVDFDPGPGYVPITPVGSDESCIVKLNSIGDLVWVKQIGGSGSENLYSIDLDNSGNILASGKFYGTTDFDPGVGTYTLVPVSSAYDACILKLDPSGNFIWAKSFGDNGADVATSVAVDVAGNVYTTGSYSGTVDFDPGAGTFSLTSNGDLDVFISKLDASGNFVWAKSMGGTTTDNGNAIALDAAGNIYTTGAFRLTVDLDPGVGTFTLATSNQTDVYVQKINSLGNFVWAGQIGDGSITDDIGYGIDVGSSNKIYVTGCFVGTDDFDPGVGVVGLTSFSQEDVFILKLDQCATPAAPTNSTAAAQLSICANNTTSLTASATGTVNWYNVSVGGSPLFTGSVILTSALSAGTHTYYAANTNTCSESMTRTAIIVTVNPAPTLTASSSTSLLCAGQSATLTVSGSAISYTWLPSGSGNTITVSPVADMTYTVTGTGTNNCQGTNTITQLVTVCSGLGEIDGNENVVSVYPNPFSTIFNITINLADENGMIEIYNSQGSKIYSIETKTQRGEIDLKDYAPGIYFIKVRNEYSNVTKRVIKTE